jgi:hypothetical protein
MLLVQVLLSVTIWLFSEVQEDLSMQTLSSTWNM